jgi:hypothetical protein
MLLKITCSPNEVTAAKDYYESSGLEFTAKQTISRDEVTLTFRVPEKDRAAGLVGDLFLEFEDGSTSPMYIRKDRNLES